MTAITRAEEQPTPAQPGDPLLPANPLVPQTPRQPDPGKPAQPVNPDQPVPEVSATPLVPVEPPGGPTSTIQADSGGTGLALVGLLLVVALALGVVIGLLLRRAQAGGRPAAGSPASAAPGQRLEGTPPAAAADPAGAAITSAPGEVARERARGDALAAALVEVRDRVDNPALTDSIAAALERAGWFAIDPVGSRFDPGAQRAVDREPTDDPTLDGTVASTERLGYRDAAGTVLRTPEVVVRSYEARSTE